MIQSVIDVLGSDARYGTATNTTSSSALTNHLLISIGVSNSGKTYSVFGSGFERNQDQIIPKIEDGLVKRILHDLFSMGASRLKTLNSTKNNISSRRAIPMIEFAVQVSMAYVYNDQVYDMLSNCDESNKSEPSKGRRSRSTCQKREMNRLQISQHAKTKDFIVSPHVITTSSMVDACVAISHGLQQGRTAPTLLNSDSSRGHTIITIRPVFVHDCNTIEQGGVICVLDMAGIERNSQQHATISKIPTNLNTSVSINTSISALLQCLRALKANVCKTEIKRDEEHQDHTTKKHHDPSSSIQQNFEGTTCSAKHLHEKKHHDPSSSIQQNFEGTNCSARVLHGNTSLLKENHTSDHFLSPKSLLRRRFAQSPALVKQDENQYGISVSKQSPKKINLVKKAESKCPLNIPFRNNKLTMLLQPLISGTGLFFMNGDVSRLTFMSTGITHVQTSVDVIVFAYPGEKDYHEKKYILAEVGSLVGLSWLYKHSNSANSENYMRRESSDIKSEATRSDEATNKGMVIEQQPINSRSEATRSDEATNKGMVIEQQPINSRHDSVDKLVRIKELEDELLVLKEENKMLKRVVDELKESNRTGEFNQDHCTPPESTDKTKRDTEYYEFLEIRRRQQTLLPSPLVDHIKIIEEHRMIETGLVRRDPVYVHAPFPLSANKGRKRFRGADGIGSDDDAQLWKYLGGYQNNY